MANEFDEGLSLGTPSGAEPNEFDEGLSLGTPPSKTSILGTLATHAATEAPSMFGGMAGAGAGAELGGAVGAFGGPFAPVTVPVGALLGGIGGFMLGAHYTHKAQDYALSQVAPKWKDALEETERAQEKEHPYASFIGGLIPYTLTLSPFGAARKVLKPNATSFERMMADPRAARVFGAGIMGGLEAGNEYLSDDAISWPKVAIATGFGLVFNKPYGLGEKISAFGERVARPIAAPIEQAAVRRYPTLIDAWNMKQAGPGATEETASGTAKMNPDAEAAANAAKQAELAVFEPPANPHLRRTVETMYPDMMATWNSLHAIEAELLHGKEEGWRSPDLDAITARIHELSPEVQQAFQRVEEAAPHAAASARRGATLLPTEEAPATAPTIPQPEPVQNVSRETLPGAEIPPTELAAEPLYATTAMKAAIAADIEREMLAAGRPPQEAKDAAAFRTARLAALATAFRGKIGTAENLYGQWASIVGGARRPRRAVPPAQGAPPAPAAPAATPVPARAHSAAALTGNSAVDAVVNDPVVKARIDNPTIENSSEVPYGAGASAKPDDPTTHLDKSIPRQATISGVTFDPAVPANIHEQVERAVMEREIARFKAEHGREPDKAEMNRIWDYAHHDFAEPAENAWVRAQGIDVHEYDIQWIKWLRKTSTEDTADAPPDLYRKPYNATPEGRLHGDKDIAALSDEEAAKKLFAERPPAEETQTALPPPIEVKPKSGPRGAAAKPEETWSLLQFLAAKGGIRNDEKLISDLRSTFGGGNRNYFVPSFGTLIRPPKQISEAARRGGRFAPKTLDAAREAAAEAGYLPMDSTPADLLELIDREVRGNRVYREGYLPPERQMDPVERELHEHRFIESLQDKVKANGGELSEAEAVRAREIWLHEGVSDPDEIIERIFLESKDDADRAGTYEPIYVPGWDDAAHAAGTPRPGDVLREPAGREGTAGEPTGAPGGEDAGAEFFQRKRGPRNLIEEREAEGQLPLPGTERIGQGELAQRKAEEPLKPTVEQKPMDIGLFGDEAKQRELFQNEFASMGIVDAEDFGRKLNELHAANENISQAEIRKNLPEPLSRQDRDWENYGRFMSPDDVLGSEIVWGAATLGAEQGIGRAEAFAAAANDLWQRMGANRFITPDLARRYMAVEEARMRGIGVAAKQRELFQGETEKSWMKLAREQAEKQAAERTAAPAMTHTAGEVPDEYLKMLKEGKITEPIFISRMVSLGWDGERIKAAIASVKAREPLPEFKPKIGQDAYDEGYAHAQRGIGRRQGVYDQKNYDLGYFAGREGRPRELFQAGGRLTGGHDATRVWDDPHLLNRSIRRAQFGKLAEKLEQASDTAREVADELEQNVKDIAEITPEDRASLKPGEFFTAEDEFEGNKSDAVVHARDLRDKLRDAVNATAGFLGKPPIPDIGKAHTELTPERAKAVADAYGKVLDEGTYNIHGIAQYVEDARDDLESNLKSQHESEDEEFYDDLIAADLKRIRDAVEFVDRGGREAIAEIDKAIGAETEAEEFGWDGELLQGPQGSILGIAPFVEGVRPSIWLGPKANASTIIHESGHEYAEQMFHYAQHPDAPEWMVKDAETLAKHAGAKVGEPIPTRAHEKIAKWLEQYFREGTAPTSELAGVFQRFKQWLRTIYQTLKGLGSPLNDDVRKVFDRWFTDEPGRIPIAPPRPEPWTEANTWEERAGATDPEEMHGKTDQTLAEIGKVANSIPGVVRDELNAKHAALAAEDAARTQPAGEAGLHPEPGADLPKAHEPAGPLPPSSAAGEEALPGIPRSGEVGAGGAGLRASTERPAGVGEQPGGAGDQPLASPGSNILDTPESLNVGKNFNVRVENITSQEQLMRALDESAERIAVEDGVTGQVVSMGEMLDLAEDFAVDAKTVTQQELINRFGVKNLAAKIVALRRAVRDAAQLFHDATVRARDSSNPADIVAAVSALQRVDMIHSVLSSVTSEMGRGLGMGFRPLEGVEGVKDVNALNQLLKDQTGRTLFQWGNFTRLASELDGVKNVSQFVRDQKKHSFGKMILEYWINGLISGPTTHITYMIGNALLALQKAGPETAAAALIGAVRRGMGREGDTVRLGEIGAQFNAGRRAITPALKAAVDALRTGLTTALPGETEASLLPLQIGGQPIAPPMLDEAARLQDVMGSVFGLMRGIKESFLATGALPETAPMFALRYSNLGAFPDIEVRLGGGGFAIPLGGIVRAPGRGVAGIHSFYRSLVYSMQKAAGAYRSAANAVDAHGNPLTGEAFDRHVANKLTNPSEREMQEYATAATETALMGKGGPLANAVANLTNVTVNLPLLGDTQILKFIDPFVKISGNILKQTIVERTPAGILSSEIRADLSGARGTVAQDTAMARMLMGTSYALLIGGLAAEGYVTGSGPTDPKDAAAWRELGGNQPHSVRIGDMWYDIHRLGPLGMLMGIAADMYEVAHAANEGEFLEAGMHLQHAITQNILDESFMRGPSDLIKAVDDPGRYGEAYIRSTLSSFIPYSVGMAQVARAADPYTRQARTVVDEIKRKIPGLSEELYPRRDIWGDPVPSREALIAKGVTAIYQQKINTDPVSQAMLQLGVWPGHVKRNIRNQPLDDEQYDEFQRIAGRSVKQRLDVIVNSRDFAGWPNHVRRNVIQEVIHKGREAARGLMFMKYPQILRDATQARMDQMMED